MQKYKIRIYGTAKKDLMDIIDYINKHSSKSAIRQYDNIIETIGSLETMPERCPLLKDNLLRLRGYRMLLVDNYVVFYVIAGNIVQIRRILYGGRKYEWLL